MAELLPLSTDEVKACCAAVYSTDWMRWLLGDSFHPGGLALTEHLGRLLELTPADRVLDVASGKGDSALHLARTFSCQVVGVDLSQENVEFARQAARDAGLEAQLAFHLGDAERLPFADGSFDALICECAFCTFPSKTQAAAELARILRPGGRLGLSDLTRSGPLPEELQTLLAWVSCIADAQPLERYVEILQSTGFMGFQTEDHGEALAEMVRQVRLRLMGGQLLSGLSGISDTFDLGQASTTARHAADAVKNGLLSYMVLTASRPIRMS